VATEDASMASGLTSGATGGSASVAGRYASALFDLATEQRQLPDVETNLLKFQQLLDANPDLQRLVRSPVFSADEQLKAISAIVEKAGIGGLGGNFLRLIARNRRLFAVPDMIKSFRALAARARGEVQAEVVSALPLTETQMNALKDTLRTSVGKDVQLNTKVDPTVLGGLIVKIGSRMIDSSLRTKLSTLQARMKEVR
jgi:F-type H+-transporting ATPase subunit delta